MAIAWPIIKFVLPWLLQLLGMVLGGKSKEEIQAHVDILPARLKEITDVNRKASEDLDPSKLADELNRRD